MNYDWLKTVDEPPLVRVAMRHYGLKEAAGDADNADILKMAEFVERVKPGAAKDYKHDAVPWCGLFLAFVAGDCGYDFPDKPLWALNWAGFGEKVPAPEFGDVVVFNRFDKDGKFIGGHVGLYVGEDESHFHVLGGNQKDSVSVVRIERARLHQARRPKFVHLPPAVKPIRISADGAPVSTNEA
jgi:uncharacterized protein (TIGR02594 family)